MRGYLSPALRPTLNDHQTRFASLGRGRRAKLATAARTTLLKADQWARGSGADASVAEALTGLVASLKAKKK